MIIDDNKYIELLEDYEELKQTQIACEIEYRRLIGCYNKVVEQNKIMQQTLKEIKDIVKNSSSRHNAIKKIKSLCEII